MVSGHLWHGTVRCINYLLLLGLRPWRRITWWRFVARYKWIRHIDRHFTVGTCNRWTNRRIRNDFFFLACNISCMVNIWQWCDQCPTSMECRRVQTIHFYCCTIRHASARIWNCTLQHTSRSSSVCSRRCSMHIKRPQKISFYPSVYESHFFFVQITLCEQQSQDIHCLFVLAFGTFKLFICSYTTTM